MSSLKWALAVCVVAAAGTSCKKTPTAPTPTPTDEIFYTAIAASDGIGYLSSVPCIPFDPNCPGGTGYVYILKRRLQTDNRTVTLMNLSVPGAVMSPAMQALARDIGQNILSTFYDQVSALSPTTTHITIFAGGNDANVIGQNIRAGRGAADIRAFIDGHVRQWGDDLTELVRRMRARAPNARIVALNLPNLGAAPYVAANPVMERSVLQRIAVSLSDRVNALASQNVLIVDLMCDPRIYDASSFSSDGFHPSDRGYQIMADLTFPALANGIASAPSSTCGPRTLLPIF